MRATHRRREETERTNPEALNRRGEIRKRSSNSSTILFDREWESSESRLDSGINVEGESPRYRRTPVIGNEASSPAMQGICMNVRHLQKRSSYTRRREENVITRRKRNIFRFQQSTIGSRKCMRNKDKMHLQSAK